MPGPGGGPSRRSHTKSRKGCKTCKRRHIRCDETFPQCKNCTKHQVRCDYNDSAGTPEETLRITTGGALPWTSEIERGVDSWRQTGQSPFPDLPIYPPLQVKNLSRNEVRLLYHVCSSLDHVTSSRTSKLGLWTDLMPKFLGLASSNHCLMQAVLAFSAAILAWENGSEETRSIGANYSTSAHSALQEASSNPDAMLAALILLSWVETSWDRWARLSRTANRIMSHIQAYPSESIFVDFVSKQNINFSDTFNEDTSFPLTEKELQERPKVYEEIESALSKLQSCLNRPELDQEWINHFTSYISQIIGAKRAQSPKEQFNYLYHLRKLLLWAPVSMLSLRNGDIQSLLVLSHFYAAALRLEVAFPDVGAAYLGNLVLNPLEEILSVLQMCQANPTYASMAHTTSMLIDFPQNVVNEYRSRRQWASRQSGLQTTLQPPYELNSISVELGNQFASQYAYTPSLSPAFTSSTPHLVSPPVNSTQTPRSPFLQVPNSGVDSYSYQSYSSPIGSYQTTPTSTFGASPLHSPGFKSTADDGYNITQADYVPTILTTPMTLSEVIGSSPYGSYGMTSSVADNGYPGGIASITGGCVTPTAVWT